MNDVRLCVADFPFWILDWRHLLVHSLFQTIGHFYQKHLKFFTWRLTYFRIGLWVQKLSVGELQCFAFPCFLHFCVAICTSVCLIPLLDLVVHIPIEQPTLEGSISSSTWQEKIKCCISNDTKPNEISKYICIIY